jgi:hypothetical protein
MKQFTVKMMIPVLAIAFAFQGNLAHAGQNEVTTEVVLNQQELVNKLSLDRDEIKGGLANDAARMKILEQLANNNLYALFMKHSEEFFGFLTASGVLGTVSGIGLALKNSRATGVVMISSLLTFAIGVGGGEALYKNDYARIGNMSDEGKADYYESLITESKKLTIKLAGVREQLAKEKETLKKLNAQLKAQAATNSDFQ